MKKIKISETAVFIWWLIGWFDISLNNYDRRLEEWLNFLKPFLLKWNAVVKLREERIRKR